MRNVILHGDVLAMLKTLPSNHVQCVVTSPPYWALRDYGVNGQLGLEKTPEEYVAKMLTIFQEVKRVLRDDGTLWLNLGDSYTSGGRNSYHADKLQFGTTTKCNDDRPNTPIGLKPKDMIGMPWRIAFALQADGWYLRSDIIWHKPNPMPESVTDRPTKSHEYIFLLTKSARYYYDAEAIRETLAESTLNDGRNGTGRHTQGKNGTKYNEQQHPELPSWYRVKTFVNPESGRNKRSVWTIPTQPYSGAHFATFPTDIPEICIKAGTSQHGCCLMCGKGWERIVEHKYEATQRTPSPNKNKLGAFNERAANMTRDGFIPNRELNISTLGWQPQCKCDGEIIPSIVLDPFAGSGTTLEVAKRLGRDYIGIELNEKYIRELIEPRLAAINPLFSHCHSESPIHRGEESNQLSMVNCE